ncbi:hypothetical protein [Parasediminibacterium sp. JCM 36343]
MKWIKKILEATKKGETIYVDIELDARHFFLIIGIILIVVFKIRS